MSSNPPGAHSGIMQETGEEPQCVTAQIQRKLGAYSKNTRANQGETTALQNTGEHPQTKAKLNNAHETREEQRKQEVKHLNHLTLSLKSKQEIQQTNKQLGEIKINCNQEQNSNRSRYELTRPELQTHQHTKYKLTNEWSDKRLPAGNN